tara:strand:+ start:1681 stop:1854 length:174 start_codon:yes stop_codon:yes gene_type:complete
MTNSEKRLKKFDVGVKLINRFQILAETREEAVAIVKSYPEKLMVKEAVVSIDYVHDS